jgi:hypothetical protein
MVNYGIETNDTTNKGKNMRLLTTSPKIEKSDKAGLGYLSTILYLAPYKLSGFNVCSEASPGCIKGCLNTAGMGGVFPKIQLSRIARTKFFFENRPAFLAQLRKEIDSFVKKCKKNGVKACIRINGTSDLNVEAFDPALFTDYPEVQFMDYTKIFSKMVKYLEGKFPPNYHLTFSRSEVNDEKCRRILLMGGNVAVVFKGKILPEKFMGYNVFSGDDTDLRFLDPKNCVVGLTAKGRARRDDSGFVVDLQKIDSTLETAGV